MLSASDIKSKIEENKKRMREEFLSKHPRFISYEAELEWISGLIEGSIGNKTLEFRDLVLIKIENADKFIEDNLRGLEENKNTHCVFFKETEVELKNQGYLIQFSRANYSNVIISIR